MYNSYEGNKCWLILYDTVCIKDASHETNTLRSVNIIHVFYIVFTLTLRLHCLTCFINITRLFQYIQFDIWHTKDEVETPLNLFTYTLHRRSSVKVTMEMNFQLYFITVGLNCDFLCFHIMHSLSGIYTLVIIFRYICVKFYKK